MRPLGKNSRNSARNLSSRSTADKAFGITFNVDLRILSHISVGQAQDFLFDITFYVSVELILVSEISDRQTEAV